MPVVLALLAKVMLADMGIFLAVLVTVAAAVAEAARLIPEEIQGLVVRAAGLIPVEMALTA
jgi:hypothetical protein